MDLDPEKKARNEDVTQENGVEADAEGEAEAEEEYVPTFYEENCSPYSMCIDEDKACCCLFRAELGVMVLGLLNFCYFVFSILFIWTARQSATPFIIHSFVLLLSFIVMLCARHRKVVRESHDGKCASVTYFILMLISYIIFVLLGIFVPGLVWFGATMSRSDSNCQFEEGEPSESCERTLAGWKEEAIMFWKIVPTIGILVFVIGFSLVALFRYVWPKQKVDDAGDE